jgi:hypothetical protein
MVGEKDFVVPVSSSTRVLETGHVAHIDFIRAVSANTFTVRRTTMYDHAIPFSAGVTWARDFNNNDAVLNSLNNELGMGSNERPGRWQLVECLFLSILL